MSEELKKITQSFEQQGKMAFLNGATKEQISQFEKENKVEFPSKFREWLLFSDGGECFLPAGVQFYGVAHPPLINVNDDDIPNEKYVVIGALSTGDPVLCERNPEKISIYNHDARRIESDETYGDFFAFLCDLREILGIGD